MSIPLFKYQPLTFDEEYTRFRRLLKSKTTEYMVSFGTFLTKDGRESYSLWMTVTTNAGLTTSFSSEADGMVDMVANANTFLESI